MTADWLDRNEYPFESRFFDQPAGQMHYIDEGTSDHAIVMVHGNPAWSFLYRHMIKGLSGEYRCIAPDHLGFGLSEKPLDYDYLPESHAENLARLLNALDIKSATMVIQDWGGPIGTSYTLDHPDKIKSMVIINTWCWPVVGDPHFVRFIGFMASPIGQFLIKRFNLFARLIMKQAYGDSSKLTPEIHLHYLKAIGHRRDRIGCATLPGRILGSSQWLGDMWSRKEALRTIPALILWGKEDIAFRDNELNTWKETFDKVEVHEFDHVGHYVQEEMGAELCPLVQQFLSGQ